MDVDFNKDSEIRNLKENINDNIARDYIELLIKSNIELQSKISELIVINTNLMKDLRNLLDIMKQAALEKAILEKYGLKKKKSKRTKKEKSKLDENNITDLAERRFEEIIKTNLKMLEVLQEISNELKAMNSRQDSIINASINNNPNRINSNINSASINNNINRANLNNNIFRNI